MPLSLLCELFSRQLDSERLTFQLERASTSLCLGNNASRDELFTERVRIQELIVGLEEQEVGEQQLSIVPNLARL